MEKYSNEKFQQLENVEELWLLTINAKIGLKIQITKDTIYCLGNIINILNNY